ncbi:hypothetical protein RF11_13859 [Thelohanellus kitauei]|uniref:Uncharacterized protein n=1 Tax=Thelohanellus kitauei TaxID=669202 RepID=A0A0C2JDJ0_THEKT|nr:hypothetical protein RF11_13859 [Thelohanellus kitauei]
MLRYVAIGELNFGHHPIAVAIYNYIVGMVDTAKVMTSELESLIDYDITLCIDPGNGFEYKIEGNTVHLGNYEYMKKNNISIDKCTLNQDLTQVFAAINEKVDKESKCRSHLFSTCLTPPDLQHQKWSKS